MTTSLLVACSACARHVRANESDCPFCGAALAASVRSAPSRAPSVRLTRAALFALGTGALAVAPSCSSGSEEPPYGLPPMFDAAGDDGSTTITPPYGLAPIPEAGDEFDASDAQVGVDAADGSPDGALDAAAPDAAGADGVLPQDAAPDHLNVLPPYGIAPH